MANRRIVELLAIPPQIFKVNVTKGSTNAEVAAQRSSIMGWANWATSTITDQDVKLEYEPLKNPVLRSLGVDNRTEVGLYRLDGTYRNFFPGTYYMFEDTVKNTAYNITLSNNDKKQGNVISDLIESGNGNCVLNYWEIPEEYLDSSSIVDTTQYDPLSINVTGVISQIKGTLKSDVITYTPQSGYSQGVRNAKARYGQSVTVKVYNPASGASLTKNIYDALPANAIPSMPTFSLPYRIAADIRPDGYPIFSFQYNDGGTDQLSAATEYIKGASWTKVSLDGHGINGSYFEKLALNNAREELNTRTALGILGSAATIGVGIATAGAGYGAMAAAANGASFIGNLAATTNVNTMERRAAYAENYAAMAAQGRSQYNRGLGIMGGGGIGLAGTVGSYIVSAQKLENQEAILNARSVTAVAPITIGNSEFVRDTGMNKFYYVFTSYSNSDMWNFDAFLTQYGYNVGNMQIRNRHFYSRLKFNYVRINDITLTSNSNNVYMVGRSILEKVKTQLQQGVRIWRVPVNAYALLPDGNDDPNPDAY